ncbi:MAG: hypothetical protein II313_00135, partial [Anaerotignum sp.]|nr:hypothetical protein [Anaerotignum sp.]
HLGKLKANGLKVYAHTTNRYLTMQYVLNVGVDGIYTDRIKPYELPWIGVENSRKLTEQTLPVGGKEVTLKTMKIFGKTYVPLRQMAAAGKGFSADFNKDANTLNLQKGKMFTSLGNEMLMDNSGRLITKKAPFKLLLNGRESGIQCYYVDGEVYAPLDELLSFVQK